MCHLARGTMAKPDPAIYEKHLIYLDLGKLPIPPKARVVTMTEK